MIICKHCHSEKLQRRGTLPSGAARFACTNCGKWMTDPLSSEPDIDQSIVKSNIKKASQNKRLVVTSAQNGTPVNKDFLATLLNYCEHNNAQLLTVPYRYRNPNSLFREDEDVWASEIQEYLIDEKIHLHDGLVLLGNIKTQPTAVNPLTGLEGFTSTESIIVGHPKIALESIATRQGDMAKLVMSTGSVTLPNYTDSKAGAKGEHHHSQGAVVVELDGDVFHVRHLHAKDGVINDLDKKYTPTTVEYESAEAVVLGDLHFPFTDGDAIKGTKKLLDQVNPKYAVYHDCIDSFSISHHHQKQPFVKYAKVKYGMESVQEELEETLNLVRDMTPTNSEAILVASNHQDHIRRWVDEADWKSDPVNAEFYLKTALYMLQNTYMTSGGPVTPDPFAYWAEGFKCLGYDESFQVCGVELGLHGDLGGNGSRGSPVGLSRIGTKAIVGHYHRPVWKDGLASVGTLSSLGMHYASGPSSWLQSNIVLFKSGRWQHVHIINGKYGKSQGR